MSTTWKTKWGPRRVRVELPTLEEALDAAADFSTKAPEQIAIAANLMDVAVDDVRAAAERILRERARVSQTIQHRVGRRPVVVERKAPRRLVRAH